MKHRNKKFSKSSFSRACLFLLPSLIGVLVLFVVPYLDVPSGSGKYGFIFIGMRAIAVISVLVYRSLPAEK